MTLRTRLTLLYTALLSVLLLVLAVAVLTVMQSRLLRGIDLGLSDAYNQYTKFAESFGIRPYLTTLNSFEQDPENQLNASNRQQTISSIRNTFPNNNVQSDPLIGEDLEALARDANTGPAERDDVLLKLRALIGDRGRLVVGIDPNAPIELTDAQLLRLVMSPAHQLLLNLEVKDLGRSPVKTRVLVRLTTFSTVNPIDRTVQNTTAITYFGRSLEDTSRTIGILQTLMLVLFLMGAGTAAAGAYLLAGQALAPLRTVKRAADRIGGQTLAVRVPEPKTGDEVQALAHALNRMLDRLEESFESQRRFTSDASHELRTPVTAIQGHASYLLRRTSPTDGQKESLNIIKSESERLTLLIGSLLELARSDGGAMQLRREPVLALLLLQDVARELRPLAVAQGTVLEAEGQDVTFEGDGDRIKQVVINLVSNALKVGAMHIRLLSHPEVGSGLPGLPGLPGLAPAAKAGASRQQGAARRSMPGVRISVQDDGPGIAREHLARLFDRFYRVEESRARDKGGAGLGLAIVKSIVDAHGGHIWFESEVGHGTKVNVWFPLGNLPALGDDVA